MLCKNSWLFPILAADSKSLTLVLGKLSLTHKSLAQEADMYSVQGLRSLMADKRSESPSSQPQPASLSVSMLAAEWAAGEGSRDSKETSDRARLGWLPPASPFRGWVGPTFTLWQAVVFPEAGPGDLQVGRSILYHPHGDHSAEGGQSLAPLILGQKRHVMHLTCTFTCMACVERQEKRNKEKSVSESRGPRHKAPHVSHSSFTPIPLPTQ